MAQVFSSWPATLVINLVALAIALLALAASIRSMRRSRDERVENSGGVMQAGEGRARFLAVWGIWTSVLFLIAISANTIAGLWRGLCPT